MKRSAFDLNLDKFDYGSESKVLAALSLLPKNESIKFLSRMKQINLKAFLSHLQTSVLVRSLVLEGLGHQKFETLLTSLDIDRKVVNNPSISPRSRRFFGVCEFNGVSIAAFVKSQCQRLLRCLNFT